MVTNEGINSIALEDRHDDHGKEEHGQKAHHKDEYHKDESGHEKKDAGPDRHKDHADDKHAEHDHGAFDPHGWQSLKNAVIYVDNITGALAKAHPANAATFYGNHAAYVAEIEALDAEIRRILAGLPSGRRTVVTSHDAFQYFGRDYGLKFLAHQGLNTDSEASAKDVAKLIKQMREQGISAVFVENITDKRLLEQIAIEAGAAIGGLFIPARSPAPTVRLPPIST